jgi:predicted SAM-dependent methyltransferase
MPLILDLPEVRDRDDVRRAPLRVTWTRQGLLDVLSPGPVRALDVGAGRHPLTLRTIDEVVTVDFDETSSPTVAIDFSNRWPFGKAEFDLIYLSHVVEHLYPSDRDELIRNVYSSTRPGGYVLIRVPHRSSIQATGWEHHSVFGMNGAMSLCHGYNPTLPMFRAVSVGVALTTEFDRQRTGRQRVLEDALNRKFRLTDQFLSKIIGGIEEVQFLLQRLPEGVEATLREDTRSGHAN